MNKFFRVLLLVLMTSLIFSACSSDNDSKPDLPDDPVVVEKPYENGFFVLNEGQFPNEGSVTFISEDLTRVEQEIFKTNNGGDDVGAAPQSMFFDGDRAFVISNASNFISVVNRFDFKLEKRISGDLNVPRYACVSHGKAYVTNFGSNHLTVIDLAELKVEKTIPVGGPAEFILKADNGLIYIQQSAFDAGNTILVLNPETDEIIEEITTADKLNSIAVSGEYLFSLTHGKLQKFDLNNHNLISEIALDYPSASKNLVADGGKLYFTSGAKVFSMNVNDQTTPEQAILEYDSTSSWGVFYGFTVKDSIIYIAEGGDFASSSFVELYNINGDFIVRKTVGIGPNGFYFNL